MIQRAEGVRVAYPLFQAEGGGSTPTSALQLRIECVEPADAKRLNRLWHSRLPTLSSPTALMKPCFGAEFDGLWYAVAIWSFPIARMLPQDGSWLELRRMAIAPDAPRNTASRMLRIMAALIGKARPEVKTLVSYQDTEVHTGGIYRAAGWRSSRLSDGGEWTRPSRWANTVQSGSPKQRWEKSLRT
jgi:hypothetical protein